MTIGRIAFGTLCTKVLAVANTLPEMLSYSALAIAVCASCTALITLSNRASQPAVRSRAAGLQPEATALKLMADQTPFAESRLRLLALAERMEKHKP